MLRKYFIAVILYLSNIESAYVPRDYFMTEYPDSFLEWIWQTQHIPGANWLNAAVQQNRILFNQRSKMETKSPIQIAYPYTCNNYRALTQTQAYPENYWYQRLYRPSCNKYFLSQKMIQSRPQYAEITQQKVPVNNNQPVQSQYPLYMGQPTQLNQLYANNLYNLHQKMQPMVCVPIHYLQQLKIRRSFKMNEGNEESENDLDSEEYENETHELKHPVNSTEVNSISKTVHIDPISKTVHIDQSNPHKNSLNPSQKLTKLMSKTEAAPVIATTEDHKAGQKGELHKKKKRRRHRRGLRINKKIGRTLLKGVHVTEDVAASGALGPQMKAAAIAAKSAETAIDGAVKGESPEQIMKKTAMTAANSAVGGSMKAQIMSGLASQAGLPVPPIAATSGASPSGPLDMNGGGNLKQQLINQAGQQALSMAIAKSASPNQNNQVPIGSSMSGTNLQVLQPSQQGPVNQTNLPNLQVQQQQMVSVPQSLQH